MFLLVHWRHAELFVQVCVCGCVCVCVCVCVSSCEGFSSVPSTASMHGAVNPHSLAASGIKGPNMLESGPALLSDLRHQTCTPAATLRTLLP